MDGDNSMTPNNDAHSEDGIETIPTTWQPSMGIRFAQQSQTSILPHTTHARHFSTHPASQAGLKDMFPSVPPKNKQPTSSTARVQQAALPTTSQRLDSPASAKGALQRELIAMTEARDQAEKSLKFTKGISSAREARVAVLEQELSSSEMARTNLEQERDELADQNRTLEATFEERVAAQVREEQEKLQKDKKILQVNQDKHNQYVAKTQAAIDKRYELRVKAESQKRAQDRARFRERVMQAITPYIRQLQSETELRVASANRGYLARRQRRTTSYNVWKDELHSRGQRASAAVAYSVRQLMKALSDKTADGAPNKEVVAQLSSYSANLQSCLGTMLEHRSISQGTLHDARHLLHQLFLPVETAPASIRATMLRQLLKGPLTRLLGSKTLKDELDDTKIVRILHSLTQAITLLRRAEQLKSLAQEPSEVIAFAQQARDHEAVNAELLAHVRSTQVTALPADFGRKQVEIYEQVEVAAQHKAERIVLQKLLGQWTEDDSTRLREDILIDYKPLFRRFQTAVARLLPYVSAATVDRRVRVRRSTASTSSYALARSRLVHRARRGDSKHFASETSQRGDRSSNPDAAAASTSEQVRQLASSFKPASKRTLKRRAKRERLRANATAVPNEHLQAEDSNPGAAFSAIQGKASTITTPSCDTARSTVEAGSVRYYPLGVKRMYSTWQPSRAGPDSASEMLLARSPLFQLLRTCTADQQDSTAQSHDSEWESCSEDESASSARLIISGQASDFRSSIDDDNSQSSHVHSRSGDGGSQTSSYALSDDGSDSQQSIICTQEDADSKSTHSVDITALDYQIPEDVLARALRADSASEEGAWSFELYSNSDGKPVSLHYHTTFAQAEAAAADLLTEPVLGFDLEWEEFSKPGTHEIKRCVSLLQLANESACHLFHIARWDGSTAADLMPPSLQKLLMSTTCIKAGVNVAGDAGRILRCFEVEMQGVFELSHMYRLVMFGADEPSKVNKVLIKLADQVQQLLLLPLPKGEVRTSKWSSKLKLAQCQYAASDAYAGFRLFHALDEKRRSLKPTPPRPAFWELRLPIELADGTLSTSIKRVRKGAAVSTEADQDDAEDEFFDALESQDNGDDGAEATMTIQETNTGDDVISTARQTASSAHTRLESDELRRANEWSKIWLEKRSETSQITMTAAPLRAYHLWHIQEFSVEETAAVLRTPPLASNTVASYVLDAIVRGQLAYDNERLKPIVQKLPRSVQARYRGLITKLGL
ncbi:hypothetical protein AMS68_005445 [Peltaster fructicola]|uniref:3'-5' exonuclease domain-containing protein n=1 Tax=Peltaster fructicola TaxID=286661 RepID=A0A6H0XZA6_9PEZI|nr:hypothetical protein AMS68_005445 [Peltaster fructicola]